MDELLLENTRNLPPFPKKSVKNATVNKLLISGTILHAEIYRQLLR